MMAALLLLPPDSIIQMIPKDTHSLIVSQLESQGIENVSDL